MIEKKYIAPNAITALNMLLGYLSITASLSENYSKAVMFIIIAMFCDTLDGKTARKLDAYSEFGKEFDSFCDAVSFGLAPGILVYSILENSRTVGSFILPISFIYALCGVVRLVKFNIVTVASDEKDDFSGMPIPTAAAVICSYILFCNSIRVNFGVNLFYNEVLVGLTLMSAYLMVSTIPFRVPEKVFNFIPKKYMFLFMITIILTLKYSMLPMVFYYILYNLKYYFYNRFKEEN